MSTPISISLRSLYFAFTVLTITHNSIAIRADLPGRWELLVSNAGIASMHTAVTRFNTIILLDRTDIGPSNLTLPNNQCRNDPNDLILKHDCYAHSALLDIHTNKIHPLMILTDTWCSSGQFLPDGTLLQSGGWNDGALKFRKFAPCNSTSLCDWEEIKKINLYKARWYATNQILPDGTIIIVGGRSANSVEYFPPRHGRAVSFPFLAKARDGNGGMDNLYPYVHLLPRGNLFIFANTQSVLYDYNKNKIVKVLPQLEGGPRNYPSAGSSAMLALEGNYSMATIVICGGAQYGAYTKRDVDSPAQKSCGRIVATMSDPVWEMEYMPFRRIMGDMVMLPTGDLLIINGAKAGTQGFKMATDPCLNPVLYQSDQPLGLRFMTLKPSSIPRMYHSTANLLPDGRILIAGSNTHQDYTYRGDFPTELRIEAFSPMYLETDKDNLRPVVVGTPETVHYKEDFEVLVTVPSSVVGIVEVNFASAPFTTHSFSQGQRMIKLVVTTVVPDGSGHYKIGCTAPPNGNVAPPGWYMMFAVNQEVPSIACWVQLIS